MMKPNKVLKYMSSYDLLKTCIDLFEIQSDREGETEKRRVFHPLVHFLNTYHSQGWARPVPGTRISISVSHVNGRESRCISRQLNGRLNSSDSAVTDMEYKDPKQ